MPSQGSGKSLGFSGPLGRLRLNRGRVRGWRRGKGTRCVPGGGTSQRPRGERVAGRPLRGQSPLFSVGRADCWPQSQGGRIPSLSLEGGLAVECDGAGAGGGTPGWGPHSHRGHQGATWKWPCRARAWLSIRRGGCGRGGCGLRHLALSLGRGQRARSRPVRSRELMALGPSERWGSDRTTPGWCSAQGTTVEGVLSTWDNLGHQTGFTTFNQGTQPAPSDHAGRDPARSPASLPAPTDGPTGRARPEASGKGACR